MKKTLLICCILLGVIAAASAQPAPPAPKISPNKWFKDRRGYEEALALQKQTGTPMFIYFVNSQEPNERGLCTWFENQGLGDGKVKKAIQDFIKVRVELPLSRRDEETFKKFRIGKTPAVFVVKSTDQFPVYRRVFDWENKRPTLKEPEELARSFAEAATPAVEPERRPTRENNSINPATAPASTPEAPAAAK